MNTKRMKPSEVYREAALLVERGHERFACHAICAVLFLEENAHNEYSKKFSEWFRPEESRVAWMVDYNGADDDPENMETSQDRRVLALCFMAAIAEDEERK